MKDAKPHPEVLMLSAEAAPQRASRSGNHRISLMVCAAEAAERMENGKYVLVRMQGQK